MSEKASDISYRPIVIPKATFDILKSVKCKNKSTLIGLYCFYYYTAIWQNTNQPEATTGYVAKGLNMTEYKIRWYKKRLLKLGLIEDVTQRNPTSKKIEGHYIKVKFYQGQTPLKPHLWKSDSVASHRINALSNNKINALRNNTKCYGESERLAVTDTSSFDKKYAKILGNAIERRGIIPHSIKEETWVKEIAMLRLKGIKGHPIKKARIKDVINWYAQHLKDKYAPKIHKVSDFKSKFLQIENVAEVQQREEMERLGNFEDEEEDHFTEEEIANMRGYDNIK